MAVEIKITTVGLDKVKAALNELQKRNRHLKPIMNKIGVSMIGIVDRNFEAEGRPTKWQKRSPLTQGNLAISAQNTASKTKKYEKAKARGRASILRRESLKAMGNKILSQSGDLKKSITYQSDDNKVAVGPADNIQYARIHQLGGIIRPKSKKALFVPCGKRVLRLKSVKIPARPYLIVPQSEVPQIARIVADELQRGIK